MDEAQTERDLEQALGAADERDVQIRGTMGTRTITIRSIRLGQLGPFSRAIKPIWHEAAQVAAEAGVEDEDGEGGGNIASMLQRALTENTDAVIDAIAAATPLERQEAEQLDLEEALLVAEAVIAVNADFFTRRVLPAMKSLIHSQREQIIAVRAASGSTSSSD